MDVITNCIWEVLDLVDGYKPGLKILGFRVDCNPVQARGTYYMYLDDLRVVTDLYDMENHDEDDMADNW